MAEGPFQNFNPLDGQILGVFKKESTDGWDDVQILEIKMELETTRHTSTNPFKVKGCQYQDHTSASDISPLSKTVLVCKVCVNRYTQYMLQ